MDNSNKVIFTDFTKDTPTIAKDCFNYLKSLANRGNMLAHDPMDKLIDYIDSKHQGKVIGGHSKDLDGSKWQEGIVFEDHSSLMFEYNPDTQNYTIKLAQWYPDKKELN